MGECLGRAKAAPQSAHTSGAKLVIETRACQANCVSRPPQELSGHRSGALGFPEAPEVLRARSTSPDSPRPSPRHEPGRFSETRVLHRRLAGLGLPGLVWDSQATVLELWAPLSSQDPPGPTWDLPGATFVETSRDDQNEVSCDRPKR